LAEKDGNSTAQHLLGFMYATGIGNAVEADQGAVKSHTSGELMAGIIVSYVRSIGRKHKK
jgi:SEL1 protein